MDFPHGLYRCNLLCTSTSGEVAEKARKTWQKEIGAAAHSDELRKSRNAPPQSAVGLNGEFNWRPDSQALAGDCRAADRFRPISPENFELISQAFCRNSNWREMFAFRLRK